LSKKYQTPVKKKEEPAARGGEEYFGESGSDNDGGERGY